MGSTATEVPFLEHEASVNMNSSVRVQLTPRGVDVLKEHLSREWQGIPAHLARFAQTAKTFRQLDGTYIFQLPEFMAIFGPARPDCLMVFGDEHDLFVDFAIVLLPSS